MYLIANMEGMESKFRTFLLVRKTKNPVKYQCYLLPKIWSPPMGIELFVDALFFKMKLDWLKIIPIGGSNFSGWVSENWLALSRISKWIYSIVITMHSVSKKNIFF